MGDEPWLSSPAEAIARLCALQREIAENVIGYANPNDCFCRDAKRGGTVAPLEDFRHSGETIRFIEDAVREKIARSRPTPESP